MVAGLAGLRVITSKSSGSTPGVQSNPGGNTGGGRPISVETAEITNGRISQIREFTGTIKPSYSYVVASKISGRLLNLNKRIGDRVAKDVAIGRIDDTEYRQALDEAQAQTAASRASVAEATAQMEYLKKEKSRIQELVSKGVSSQADLDDIETKLSAQIARFDLAKAQLDQRIALLEQAKTRLAYTTIRTAQEGFIAVRHTDGGSLLSVNSPIVTVVGIDTVFIEISVTEKDYTQIATGQHARITVEALPGRTFKGRVTATAPLFQTETRTATVEISVVNDSLLLKPGMFAIIDIIIAEKDNAQIIPVTALATRNGINSIFIVQDSDMVSMVPVTTGIFEHDKVEILNPVVSGKVVTVGNHLLVDGSKIMTGKPDVKKGGKSDVNSTSGTNKISLDKASANGVKK